ncbi:pyridoxine 5'-phosphate synthase [Photobacterium sp. MCCC 1A19761]|uniref:pyridoxine 5'-phosphate synthase n=1 Tax=Photobacterium sp. MCCC 1A19761 TaxID=3115000 RepID=UPI003FCD43CC
MDVNAGHDLDLQNLPHFLKIKGIKEVSIGHVLMIECIERGMNAAINDYLTVCSESA